MTKHEERRLAEALAVIEAAGLVAVAKAPPPPPVKCMVCGAEDDGLAYSFTDVTLEIARSEHGHAVANRFVCDDDLAGLSEALIDLGFGVHKHGGINFLEADETECGGYGKCEELDPWDT